MDKKINTNEDFINENHIILDKKEYVYKEEPLQLISFEDNKISLNEKALDFLNSIEDNIILVSIAGKARSGKSLLINLLLNNLKLTSGFEVGSSVNSCTQGLWLWGNFRKKGSSNTKIVFLDAEGAAGLAKGGRGYDAKIFTMVVLISSLFLYNTNTNIEEGNLSELGLIADLSKSIETDKKIEKDVLLTELAPKLIWILRDFTLKKINTEGIDINGREYLDLCLRKKQGKSSGDNNLIRESILKYFTDRDCITLIRPIENEKKLQNLKNVEIEDFYPEFMNEVGKLRDRIYNDSNPKRFNGKKLTGPTLVNLIREFVSAINNGIIPNINNM